MIAEDYHFQIIAILNEQEGTYKKHLEVYRKKKTLKNEKVSSKRKKRQKKCLLC